MPRITEWYQIITTRDREQMKIEINRLIGKGVGWKPVGGVSVIQDFGTYYIQAMERPYKKGGPGRPKGSMGKPKPETPEEIIKEIDGE